MKAFVQLSVVELKLLAREPSALFFMVAFPLMLLILTSGTDRIEILLPGYISMILAIGGLTTMPAIVATYRERKMLRRLATTPATPINLLIAQVIAQLLMGLLGAAILIGVGVIGYGGEPPAHPFALALAFLLSALMLCSMGLIIAGLAPRARIADLYGMLVMFPMIFIGGAAMPKEVLPSGVRAIGDYLPLSQAITAMREAWFGSPTLLPLLILTGITVVCTVIAALVFRWD